eukprot:CAMPEP_0119376024 /NCGR_PEP_ID=MMETSP1334-20130426/38237_1 /TAXON_ID=127549 /ORGANISM="Calcidiscus leptoporus, Strain RCC1130" /LENGTH=97 /DNA_ID=CAMNT_0007394489 /DNA_START=193 /DNA_END=487 /DNA_ORIENTATION=+
MTDGSTFTSFSAVRQVGDILALERDTANHPIYLARGDGSALLDAREAARLERVLERERRRNAGVAASAHHHEFNTDTAELCWGTPNWQMRALNLRRL